MNLIDWQKMTTDQQRTLTTGAYIARKSLYIRREIIRLSWIMAEGVGWGAIPLPLREFKPGLSLDDAYDDWDGVEDCDGCELDPETDEYYCDYGCIC